MDYLGLRICPHNGKTLSYHSRWAIANSELELTRICLGYYESEENVLKKLEPLKEKGLIVVDTTKPQESHSPFKEILL